MSARFGLCNCGRVWMHVGPYGDEWDTTTELARCHECIDPGDRLHFSPFAWSRDAVLVASGVIS